MVRIRVVSKISTTRKRVETQIAYRGQWCVERTEYRNPPIDEGICNCFGSYIRFRNDFGPPLISVYTRQQKGVAIGRRQRFNQVDMHVHEFRVRSAECTERGFGMYMRLRFLATWPRIFIENIHFNTHKNVEIKIATELSSFFSFSLLLPLYLIPFLSSFHFPSLPSYSLSLSLSLSLSFC